MQAHASSFRAMPLRLHLDNDSKTEVLKIVNEGSERVTVQISIKRWSQDADGTDQYDDADDLVVFPKMAAIDAGDTRIFRVGYSGNASAKEQTYRILVQELPVTKPGEAALKFALTLSLPVFVAPQSESIEWDAHVEGLSQETLRVSVNNDGNRHLLINKIKTKGTDKRGAVTFNEEVSGWYTLGGKTHTYRINVPYQQCLKTDSIEIELDARGTQKQLHYPLNKSMCSRKPATEENKKNNGKLSRR